MGAIIISAGGFVCKIIGAMYRIPLTALLGGEGMGIYQMVYPLYCILLTVSASGIPTGIARLVASGNGEGAEKKAFLIYGSIGVLGSLLMFAFSGALASIMGEEAVKSCCRALSPAVFFVSVLSVVRGYFQGKSNMVPTAVSEVTEQIIKVGLGCLLAYIFKNNLTLAVASTLFAVTVAELVTATFAIIAYLRHNKGGISKNSQKTPPAKSILKYTIPLTLTAMAMPLSQFAESAVAIRLLRQITQEATALFGIFSGCAITIINLPVSISYGLAAASVPQIAPFVSSGQIKKAKRLAYKALLFTLAISLPCAIALYFFAPFAVEIIFKSLPPSQKQTLIYLVKIMSQNAVTSSLVQTSSACLTALGKPLKNAVTQWGVCILRVILTAVLIKFTTLSVVGAAISANCCYLVAVILNFCYIIKEGAKNENYAYRSGHRRKRFNLKG